MDMDASARQPSVVTTPTLVVAIVFPTVGTLAVALRFYVAVTTVKKKAPTLDDWVCAFALLAAWGISIDMFVAGASAGVDYTRPGLDPAAAEVVFLRTLWIKGFLLIISLTLVKIAILLFYARIFDTHTFRLAVNIFIGFLAAWGVAMLLCQLLAADPVQGAEDSLHGAQFTVAFTAMSMVLDVAVLCFPLPMVHGLRMTTARKLQVAGVLWLGLFCCVASAVRLYYLFSDSAGSYRYQHIATAYLWSIIEPNASVVAACLPCYAPLMPRGRRLWTRLRAAAGLSRPFSSSTSDNGLLEASDASYHLRGTPAGRDRKWDPHAAPRPQGRPPSRTVHVEGGEGDGRELTYVREMHPALTRGQRGLNPVTEGVSLSAMR